MPPGMSFEGWTFYVLVGHRKCGAEEKVLGTGKARKRGRGGWKEVDGRVKLGGVAGCGGACPQVS